MRSLIIVVTTLLLWTGIARSESPEAYREEQISMLRQEVELAKGRLGITAPVRVSIATQDVIAARQDPQGRVPPAWIVRDGEGFELPIIEDYLLSANRLYLEHLAQHELCHAKFGHFGWQSSLEKLMRDEALAERCVYDVLGEERYVAHAFVFMRPQAVETANHTWDEVVAGVRYSFGLSSN